MPILINNINAALDETEQSVIQRALSRLGKEKNSAVSLAAEASRALSAAL